MAIQLSEEIIKLLDDPETRKVLATTYRVGNPDVVFKGSIRVNEDGYLEYLELIESSQTNRNMVNSIWFRKSVAVAVLNGGVSYQIKGIPYRSIIAGREFERAYQWTQKHLGSIDLSAVWLIEPTELREESFEKRRAEEEEKHPILKHLDRLVINENEQKHRG
ncbi:MAG: hypothetical protein LUD71_07030 [Clostridiales bacterium]|nr:hypothetical protein [Clostridiales bacterium]